MWPFERLPQGFCHYYHKWVLHTIGSGACIFPWVIAVCVHVCFHVYVCVCACVYMYMCVSMHIWQTVANMCVLPNAFLAITWPSHCLSRTKELQDCSRGMGTSLLALRRRRTSQGLGWAWETLYSWWEQINVLLVGTDNVMCSWWE
jgi:hypothetical protein